MKTIKANTKNASRFLNSYNNSRYSRLAECYSSYSTAKACAQLECIKMMDSENGEGFRILSFNTFGFTCGWKTAHGLRIETPCNSYLVMC